MHLKDKKYFLLYKLLIVFIVISIPGLSSIPVFVHGENITLETPAPSPTPNNPLSDYSIEVTSRNVIVTETGRGMKLFLKNENDMIEFPLASKIMTALLAVEKYPVTRDSETPSTMVTISSVATSQKDAWELSLKTGEKYTLEYLLHGLILKNNNAAAIALAEQISGTVDEFVALMNTRAESIQMDNTVFKNPTGTTDKDQFTTVSDMLKLYRIAFSNETLEKIIKTKDTIIFPSGDGSSKHIFSNGSNIWSLTDNCTSVVISSTSQISSYAVTAKLGQFGIIIIGFSPQKNITEDITKIVSSIFADYEYSILVSSGMTFPKEMIIGDESIPLKFGTNPIYYVHPKNVDFIQDTIYEENEKITYPIRTTTSVAKVTFTLQDGTKISASLYPAMDIWSESSVYQKLYDIYKANKNIVHLAAALFIFMIVLGIIKIIRIIIYRARNAKSRRQLKLKQNHTD